MHISPAKCSNFYIVQAVKAFIPSSLYIWVYMSEGLWQKGECLIFWGAECSYWWRPHLRYLLQLQVLTFFQMSASALFTYHTDLCLDICMKSHRRCRKWLLVATTFKVFAAAASLDIFRMSVSALFINYTDLCLIICMVHLSNMQIYFTHLLCWSVP